MKRILVILSILVANIGFAQSIELSGARIDPGISADQFVGRIAVKNISNFPKNIMVERTINDLAANHESSFCWDNCYGPNVSVSQSPVYLQPGEVDSVSLRADLNTYGYAGMSSVRYRFYVSNSVNDSAGYTFVYNMITAVKSAPNITGISVYPNPASETLTINLSAISGLKTEFAIINTLGEKVKSVSLTGSTLLKIDVSDLRKGIYFYSLNSEGRTITSAKFLVN